MADTGSRRSRRTGGIPSIRVRAVRFMDADYIIDGGTMG